MTLPDWLAILFTSATVSFGADAKLDWKALEGEAVTILSRYIQIDTTNPPGNEIESGGVSQSDLG